MMRFPWLTFFTSTALFGGMSWMLTHSGPQPTPAASFLSKPAPLQAPRTWAEAPTNGSAEFFAWLDGLTATEVSSILDGLPPTNEKPIDGRWIDLIRKWIELDRPAAKAWILNCQNTALVREVFQFLLPPTSASERTEIVEWFQQKTGKRSIQFRLEDRGEWSSVAEALEKFDYRPLAEIAKDLRSITKTDLRPHGHYTPASLVGLEWTIAVNEGKNWLQGAQQLQELQASDWTENTEQQLMRDWLPHEPRAVMAWLQQHPINMRGTCLVDGALGGLLGNLNASWDQDPFVAPKELSKWPTQAEIITWFLAIPRQTNEADPYAPVGNPEGALLEVWSGVDVNAAGQYLNQQPPSPGTDSARARIALKAAEEDGEAAKAWAESISDPALRAKTSEEVAKQLE
jgi:hypothetical protein